MAEPVSPELALVDPTLAAALRAAPDPWLEIRSRSSRTARAPVVLPTPPRTPAVSHKLSHWQTRSALAAAALLLALATTGELSAERGGVRAINAMRPPAPRTALRSTTVENVVLLHLLGAAIRAGRVSTAFLDPSSGLVRPGTTVTCFARDPSSFACTASVRGARSILVLVAHRRGHLALIGARQLAARDEVDQPKPARTT